MTISYVSTDKAIAISSYLQTKKPVFYLPQDTQNIQFTYNV